MHLMELLRYRTDPASAVFLALTRRCPLTCRHCSTRSLMSSEEHAADLFDGFVRTFTGAEHPEFVLMSGGEALLRPRLVRSIAEQARSVGTRSYLLSGAYFARPGEKIPPAVASAIAAVDHFAVSLDVFHEEQVPRRNVIALLRRLIAEGKDVSIQIVGMDDEDPYLAEATTEIRDSLGDVPILVGHVGASGRAADWLPRRAALHRPLGAAPSPCGMASWPIVAFDGTVIACCNQELVDLGQRAPEHLRLGHAASDPWSMISRRCRQRAVLRVVRTVGPEVIAGRCGQQATAGYCESCYTLSSASAVDVVDEITNSPSFPVLEREVQRIEAAGGPVLFARRFGSRRYADLVALGHQEFATCVD